jgi:CRISPR associated protein Cas1
MRRAQCLAAGPDFGRSIVRELLQAKLDGQAAVARIMGRAETAAAIDELSGRLKTARTEPEMLATEGMAAQAYWSAWASLPVTFARQHRVPSRWKTFGPRRSSLTDKPQRAVSPANAVLNYLYGVLASQVTIALIGQGLEPGISIGLHADKQARASFTYDLLESVRPTIDLFLFFWLEEACFARRDFLVQLDGSIRLMHPLSAHLAMTAALWRAPADDVAHWIAYRLQGEKARLRVPMTLRPRLPKVAAHDEALRTEARHHALRWRIGGIIEAPIPKTCIECGRALASRRRKFCSAECSLSFHGGNPPQLAALIHARAALAQARASGRDPSQSETASGRRAENCIAWRAAVREWQARAGWSEASDHEMRRWFVATLQPALASHRPTDIARATGWSRPYASAVRAGRAVPHSRWYAMLGELAGMTMPAMLPVAAE